jgi:1-deoxy-D-xylulose-5-phosphate reductoisomerase
LKNIAVLGATGSVGKNTLDVIRCKKDFFTPVLFTAHKDDKALFALANEFPEAKIALSGKNYSPLLDSLSLSRVFYGEEGLLSAIAFSGADITLNGIAGAAGLLPSLTALQNGQDLALANKETLVMAASLAFKTAKQNKVLILPVDSEHSAIFSLINAHTKDAVREIILTASGGPFRNFTKDQLKNVSVKDALAHPTWKMGAKITIDSATMANKGLEIIEAERLFDMGAQNIKVVIHPQSIIHSMVRLKDGSVYAQASNPDMRLPIHDALFFPQQTDSPWGALDFENLTLTFEKPDTERFPMLYYAYSVLERGGAYSIAYNAANEEAVAAFLDGKISFTDIAQVSCTVLENDFDCCALSIEAVFEADKKARGIALSHIKHILTKK